MSDRSYEYKYYILVYSNIYNKWKILNVDLDSEIDTENNWYFVLIDSFNNRYKRRIEEIYGKQDLKYLKNKINELNKEKINLTLDETFEIPVSMQINNIENRFSIRGTILAQVVDMQDKILVQAIRDYAQRKAINEKENVRLILLDESIADEIINLGIKKYNEKFIKRKE